jgi:hypothetical protein|tara:strand:+ start:1624 stop:1830 length:207 start_codon:yes stop_codon:yes gene_type:complete
MVDKVVKLVLKLIVKQFKLDKLEMVYKYVFEDNELDEAVKANTREIEKIKDRMLTGHSPIKEKKWYDK